MYIEKENILYSVELLDQLIMRSATFNPLIGEIFALFFDKINGTRVENAGIFNERYDELTHFDHKDNELYHRPLEVGQAESLMVFDYNFTEIIEKVHGQLEHEGNSKTLAKIKNLHYGINKQMVEWFLKRCSVCLNHCNSNTRLLLEPIVASEVLKRFEIELVDMKSQKDGNIKWIWPVKDYSPLFMLYLTKKLPILLNSYTYSFCIMVYQT